MTGYSNLVVQRVHCKLLMNHLLWVTHKIFVNEKYKWQWLHKIIDFTRTQASGIPHTDSGSSAPCGIDASYAVRWLMEDDLYHYQRKFQYFGFCFFFSLFYDMLGTSMALNSIGNYLMTGFVGRHMNKNNKTRKNETKKKNTIHIFPYTDLII